MDDDEGGVEGVVERDLQMERSLCGLKKCRLTEDVPDGGEYTGRRRLRVGRACDASQSRSDLQADAWKD